MKRLNTLLTLTALLLLSCYSVAAVVDVNVKEWYPQGDRNEEYVFECETDFEATHHQWFFGDGHHTITQGNLPGISLQTVFHRYDADGLYNVVCQATGREGIHPDYSYYTELGSITVSVGAEESEEETEEEPEEEQEEQNNTNPEPPEKEPTAQTTTSSSSSTRDHGTMTKRFWVFDKEIDGCIHAYHRIIWVHSTGIESMDFPDRRMTACSSGASAQNLRPIWNLVMP